MEAPGAPTTAAAVRQGIESWPQEQLQPDGVQGAGQAAAAELRWNKSSGNQPLFWHSAQHLLFAPLHIPLLPHISVQKAKIAR